MQVRPVTWRTWDPFTALAKLDRDFDEVVRRAGLSGAHGEQGRVATTFVPAVEVVRDGEDVVVRFELPGMTAEDIAIEVERGKLVVSGERRAAAEQDGGAHRVLVRELRYGAFRREFALPQGLSPEQVEASYEAGMLDVRVRAVVTPEPTPVRVPVTTGSRPQAQVVEHEEQAAVASGQPETV